jgi:hypothetical protein
MLDGDTGRMIAFDTLVRAGKKPGVDFDYYQRTESNVDFAFINPPSLAMLVEEQGTQVTGVLLKAQLAGLGRTLVVLPYNLLTQDPDWLIEEALQYRDHSRR